MLWCIVHIRLEGIDIMNKIGPIFILVMLLVSGCKEEKIENLPAKTDIDKTLADNPPPVSDKQGKEEAGNGAVIGDKTPVANRAPEIVSMKLSPRLVYPGTKIRVEAEGRDEDGDTVSFYHEWKRNDNTLSGEALEELDTQGFKKGDFITAIVTPFDGKEKGKSRRSIPLIVANRPPEITSFPPQDVKEGRYVYEVKAKDPDNDALKFSLEESPPGMTIDPVTGILNWDVPVETNSESVPSYSMRVVVSDGDSKAFQGFSLNLNRGTQ